MEFKNVPNAKVERVTFANPNCNNNLYHQKTVHFLCKMHVVDVLCVQQTTLQTERMTFLDISRATINYSFKLDDIIQRLFPCWSLANKFPAHFFIIRSNKTSLSSAL